MKFGCITVIVRAVLPAALALICAAPAAHAALVVSKAATRNVTCTNGFCTATKVNAVLNVNDLAAMLAAGNVRMNSGATAMDIRVVTAIGWASTNRLFLDAYRSIDFSAPLTIEGTGSLVLTTDDGGTGGDITFENKGQVVFWDFSSGLTINGNAYTLVGDIATLVTDINAKPWGYFAWAKDYDASVDGAYRTSPIAVAFVGTFEGLGNKIEKIRFTAQKAGNFGLFALIENGGLVRDLTFSDVKINIVPDANGTYTGTVAAENHGTIMASSSSGTIKALSDTYSVEAGGLVGENRGTILHSHSSAGIVAGYTASAGGLVGVQYENESITPVISDSYATGSVTAGANSYAGGLAGINFGGTIINADATGSITADVKSFAGGLVGENEGSIEMSFATGSVTANGDVGGLAGSSSGLIETSFATGSIVADSTSFAGGLTGYSSQSSTSPIKDCFALGSVTGGIYSGGLVGKFAYGAGHGVSTSYSIGAAINAYYNGGSIGYAAQPPATTAHVDWDLDTSGLSAGCGNRDCTGVTGLSDAQLKSGLPAGFDSSIWGQSSDINGGYPYLIANPPR